MKKFNLQKNNYSKGVALVFAIVVSMILFSILAGVLSIALKEIVFSTSIKNSNDAFYAADSGIECALFNDKSDSTVFIQGGTGPVSCFNKTYSLTGGPTIFTFVVNDLDNNNSCAKVTVAKQYDGSEPPTLLSTKITSKGYNKGGNNNCDQSGLKSVERVLEVTY